MFLCRSGRLPAATLDQAFKSAGSFLVQVKANRLRDVTWTLRHTVQRHRCFCVSVRGVDSTLAHLRKQRPDPQPVQNWDSSCGFVIAHRGHLETVAVSLSRRVQSEGGYSDISRQPLVHASGRYRGRGEPAANVLFTGNWGVSSRLCSTGTMQTRSSSAAAAKKSDAGEEQTADSNKGVI